MPTPWWFDPFNQRAEVSGWDAFFWNGAQLPGLATVKVTQGAGRKLDERAAAGANGWRLKEKGPKAVKFTVTLKLWEEDHWSQWEGYSQRMARIIVRGAERTAVRVAHPVLSALNCLEAYLENVGGLEQEKVGVWNVSFEMIQFKPPHGSSASRSVQPPWFPPTGAGGVGDTRPFGRGAPAFLGFDSAAGTGTPGTPGFDPGRRNMDP